MSTIHKETGIKYRVLEDENTKTWAECSFVGVAADIFCSDGIDVETKLRGFRGISTTKQINTGYALDASVAALAPTILSGILNAGNDSVSFTDDSISDDSIIQVATDDYLVRPIMVEQVNKTVTVTFAPQTKDVRFKVLVS